MDTFFRGVQWVAPIDLGISQTKKQGAIRRLNLCWFQLLIKAV